MGSQSETTSSTRCKNCGGKITLMSQQNTDFCCQLCEREWNERVVSHTTEGLDLEKPILQEAVDALREHLDRQRRTAAEMWAKVDGDKRTPETTLADVEALAQCWRESMSNWPKPIYMSDQQRMVYNCLRALEMVLYPGEVNDE